MLAPASINPPLINCQGGKKESADVKVDKAQAKDGKDAKVPAMQAGQNQGKNEIEHSSLT